MNLQALTIAVAFVPSSFPNELKQSWVQTGNSTDSPLIAVNFSPEPEMLAGKIVFVDKVSHGDGRISRIATAPQRTKRQPVTLVMSEGNGIITSKLFHATVSELKKNSFDELQGVLELTRRGAKPFRFRFHIVDRVLLLKESQPGGMTLRLTLSS